MKNRGGFVSNSSSTSFVIQILPDPLVASAIEGLKANNLPTNFSPITVKDVARELLAAQIKDRLFEDYGAESLDQKKEQLKRLETESDDLIYILFNSCNYDTEVFQYDTNTILILTCNNENTAWDLAIDSIRGSFDFLKLYEGDGSKAIDEFYESEYYRKYSSSGQHIMTKVAFEKIKGPVLLLSEPKKI